MGRKWLALILLVLLVVMVNGASGDIELKVDFAYPNDVSNPEWDPNWIIRHEGTAKYFQDANWITLASPAWWDQWYNHSPPPFEDVNGSGIDVEVAGGYDAMLFVYGMNCVGEGSEPTGMPAPNTDPICNSEVCSARFRGAGRRGNDGSVMLTFHKLPHGSYILKGYHNDLVYLNGSTHCGNFPPLDPRVMPAVIVSGDSVTQIHDGDTNDVDVPIHQETSDANLFARGPSVVKFDFVGTGPVEVEYLTPPGTEWEGGFAVLNAFILQGVSDGTAYEPIPSDGATNVDPDVVLKWKPGEWADQHDVYLGTDLDGVNNASDPNTLPGRGRQEPNSYDPPGFLDLGQTYYWRIDEVKDGDPNSPWRGEVWSFTVDDGKAHSPDPQNGAVEVPLDANLGWSPGDYAASHDVYLGTDAYAVLWATDPNTPPGRGRQDPCSYDPGGLEFNKTYYWRIDEVNPGLDNSKGDLWFFTTTQCIVVDDMQSYDNVANHIYDTWSDGAINWTGSLVDLGVPPDDPVHDGNQSMLYIYDTNDDMSFKYAEAEAPIADLEIGPNWTVLGVEALILHFYGAPDNDVNDTEQLYVGLEDSGGPTSYREVRYGDNGEDMNDLKKEEWTAFNIELDQLGVNLTAVQKIYIGFGDRVAQVPGGSGLVYFDDFRLCVPRCIASIAQPEGDINNDCIVDYRDARIVAADWLDIDLVEVQAPDPCGLLVEYTFDNNDYNDTSGNEYHGLPSFLASVSDGKLILAPDPNYPYERAYVTIPLGADNPFGGTGNYSIQITFASTNGPGFLLTSAHPIKGGDADNSMALYTQKQQGWENLTPVVHILHRGELNQESIVHFNDGMMHTVVVTYDVFTRTMRFYDDGFQDRTWNVRIGSMAWYDEHAVRIGGCRSYGARDEFPVKDNFIGEIDSVRIYDYMLSPLEAMYLATNGTGIRPIISPANLYNQEPPGSRAINIRDFAVLANDWLEQTLWPE